ncbi:MAG: RNA polymerase sigma-70 factor [Chloroflexota bacterium]
MALDAPVAVFEEQRAYLFAIAYRLMGTVSNAEEAGQNADVRWQVAGDRDVRSARAYLATTVVRLCMDELRSARARRELYVGPWLPEPLWTADQADLTDNVILRESLSFAFLLLLEKLSPLERAVFVLREVFNYDYAEIAVTVDKTQANCRQLFHRARRRIGEDDVRFAADHDRLELLTQDFLTAMTSGDVQRVTSLLVEDVVHTPDGGGAMGAALRPIRSRDHVARGLLGVLQKNRPDAAWIDEVNGQPAIVAARDGQPVAVMLLETRGWQITRLYTVANPQKLADVARKR